MSKKVVSAVLTVWLLAVALTTVFLTAVVAQEGEVKDKYSKLKLLTDVIGLVQKNYVEVPNFDDLVEGAVKGMLTTLDPHSSYLSPDHFKDLKVETSGEFGGLGIEITVREGLLTVVSPIDGSPAFRAGVKAGDQIIKIESEFARDLSISEAIKKMRGKKGTSVTISVFREGTTGLIPITVVRDIVRVKSVRSRMLGGELGYIRLKQFQEGSSDEFLEAYNGLKTKAKDGELKGLVVDIRNNPGGLLSEAVRVSDLFLEGGLIVYTDGRLESQKLEYFAHEDGSDGTIELPTVVIINEGSASASEILAGSLQDHGEAVILGARSFGKGSVQTVLPMDSGAALRLTTALYFTKSGRSIQAEGVTPDLEVPATLEDGSKPKTTKFRPREGDLPGAIKNPNSEDKSDKGDEATSAETARISARDAMKMKLTELLATDNQLNEAYKLLKAWDRFKHIPVVRPDKAA